MAYADFIWAAVLFMLALAIFLSNSFILLAVYKSKELQTRGNVFLVSLACSDFLVALFNVPFTAVCSFQPELRQSDDMLCLISGFFEMTFLIASVFSVTAINFHRFIHIVYWQSYYEVFSRKKICLLVTLIWTGALFLSSPPLFGISKISYKRGKSHCFVDWKESKVYTFALMISCFFIPVTFMGSFYYRIYRYRKYSKKNLKKFTKESYKVTNESDVREKFCKEGPNSLLEDETDSLTRAGRDRCSSKNYETVEFRVKTASFSKILQQNGFANHGFDLDRNSGCWTISPCVEVDNEEVENTRYLAESKAVIKVEEYSKGGFCEGKFESLEPAQAPKENKIVGIDGRIIIAKSLDNNGAFAIWGEHQRAGEIPLSTAKQIPASICKPGEILEGREIFKKSSSDSMNDLNIAKTKRTCAKARLSRGPHVRKAFNTQKEGRRLTIMCVIIVAVFFISWFPFVITMILESLTTVEIPVSIDKTSLLIGYANSLSNPIIYFYFNIGFRSKIKRICGCYG